MHSVMEIRQLKTNEFEQAIQLSNITFREQGHSSMGEAFPHVFSAELGQSFGAFDGEKLVSFIGLVPAKLWVGKAVLTVFSLGSVCTHEDYRNQGISTAILNEVYRYIDQTTASLLFVSGDRGMYLRNHCYHFGETKKYIINKSNMNQDLYSGTIRKGRSADIFQVDCLRSKAEVRFASSIWEWKMLLEAGGYSSIFKMKQGLYVASRHGVIEGYAVIALPTPDSTNEQAIVIESGGDSKAVYGILMSLLENTSTSEIELTIPWHEKLNGEISKYPFEKLQNDGTIHIVDAARLINQLMPYLFERNPKIAQNIAIGNGEDNRVIIHYNKSEIELTLKEFVELVFSPKEKYLFEELETVFPIPLPHLEGMYFV